MRCLLYAKIPASITATLMLAGCLPSSGTPDRLYPVASEMNFVRTTQEYLVDRYNTFVFSAPAQAKLIRNEIIADRMYAIDVQYTEYESNLTRERQEVGFGTLATAGALGTASTLVTPVVTKSVLSGLSTLTLATKGHYDSEVLLAQTIQTIQKQMRASRNLIAANISAKLVKGVADYPLAAALSDLEDYYNAGTLTTGVIDTSTTVGIQESDSQNIKQTVTQAPPEQRAAILSNSMIGDATAPLPAPQPKQAAISVAPNAQDIQDFQLALCQPVDGKVGPALLKAAGEFISGQEGVAAPKLSKIGKSTENKLRDAADAVPNCKSAGFRNAYEVGAFGIASGGVSAAGRVKELQGLLNVPQTGKLDSPTRLAIAKVRTDKKINPGLGDQVDKQLRDQLTP
jgi:hypothetical protein